MPDITPEQRAALNALVNAVCDAVKQAGSHGAPGGVIYAAMIGKLSYNQYVSLMSILVRKGRLRKEGELYFAPEVVAA